jgi:glycosyltransferase involved in cell wall biosynthesis
MSAAPGPAEGLPVVAIIANLLPPYRVHLHQRIAREMDGEIVMHTVCTHEVDKLHRYAPPPDINAISFGPGHSFIRQLKLRYALSEWLKGGQIIRWLRRNNIKAVVLLGYNDAGRIRILRWCRQRSLPCLLFGDSNIRGDRATGAKAVIKRLLVGWIVHNVTALMVCGRLGRQYWEKYGGDRSRIFEFPYEPDYDLIQQLSTEKIDQVRARFNFAPGRRRIVFSGRFVEEKQPQLLLEAFASIAAQRPQWDLVMLGAADPSSAGHKPMLLRVSAEIKERVLFTGFLEEQWMVGAIYRASDVLCLPSVYEPWALVINEAVAAGMAIVATDVVGAAAELVLDGVNGRVIPPSNRRLLTEALLDVTASDRIDAMRAASASILADWRERGDPVNGLRQALKFAKVIEVSGTGSLP